MIESKGHKITPIDGDLAVSRNAEIGGDADIHGKARVAGSLKVEGFLDAPHIKGAAKGLFNSVEELTREYPNPRPGWFAIVLDATNKEKGILYKAENRGWVATTGEAKPYEFIKDSINVFASKGELADETQRAQSAERILTQRIVNETVRATEAENEIKKDAVKFSRLGIIGYADKLELMAGTIDGDEVRCIDIPAATETKAGVVSAEDKKKFVKSITWNNDNDPSNMNDFVVAGVYDIKGERTRANDNLPILNTGGGHTFNARLTVLDSSISGSGENDDKCITQVLSFSNRIGQGEVYIRTGKGASLDNLAWEKWSTLQRNVNVGEVGSLDGLVDNGIYSGILSTTGETFVIICINNYAIAQQVGVQHISHLKYSLVVGTGEVKIEKRTRDAYGIWTEWENIGGGSTLPEATVDTIGGVRLGNGHLGYLPIRNIDDNPYSGLGIKLGTKNRDFNVVPLVLGEKLTGSYTWNTSWGMNFLGIPIDTRYFNLTNYGLALGSGVNGVSATKVTWDADSNMNDFKTPGTYDIYGERTVKTDNLPITNDGSGHSIAAKLTVVASTLQPANNEICVTQFLQLSNRISGEGTTYVRTYNENNNSMNGWSPWQKQMGMVETLINSNDTTVGQEIFSDVAQKIGDGLNGMIDNGMYSGIYVDKLSYTGTSSLYYLSGPPTFVETFVLVVINDYAASGKLNLPRHIIQLKYAVDAITGQSTVKKRVGTGDDIISWGDWEDIGGGSSEVDVTDAVKAYGLQKLVEKGLAKEGVNYVIKFLNIDLSNKNLKLDTQNKLSEFFKNKYANSPGDGCIKFNYKVLKGHPDYSSHASIIDGVFYSDTYKYNFYIVYSCSSGSELTIQISQDMTEL